MAFFDRQGASANRPDKNSPEYAVTQYNRSRSNLLVAIVFTVVNIILYMFGSSACFLFSISFPFILFSTESFVGVVLPLLILGVYVLCYFLSKKHVGFMITAMVLFIIDCHFLVLVVASASYFSQGEISFVDFILDFLMHIYVLVYLIIGVRYSRRYKAVLAWGQTITPSDETDEPEQDQ